MDAPGGRLRYTKSTGVWTLYWPDRHSKFHRYEDLDPTSTIDRLLVGTAPEAWRTRGEIDVPPVAPVVERLDR